MVHIKPKLELVYENRCMKAFLKKQHSDCKLYQHEQFDFERMKLH